MPGSRVAVVFTGGTISTAHDVDAGGLVPTLDGADIVARTPGLDSIAEIVVIDRGRTPASHFTLETVLAIADDLRSALADPSIAGAVVVQGTDTIEETAFAWDLLVTGAKPVVVTGAMRSSDAPDFDGPANLRDAVRVAADPSSRGIGAVVVLAGSIEPADDVQKTHTTAFDTFRSPNVGPLGHVHDGGVAIARVRGPRRSVRTDLVAENVHLITVTMGMDGTLLDAALAAGARGLVVAATGSGNTSEAVLAAAVRAIGAGIPVVLASRCAAGRVEPDYAFPGGGARWVEAGAIPAGHLCGPKARIALALGIGAGLGRAGIADLLRDPVA